MINDKKTIMQITGTMNFGGAEVLMMNILRKLHTRFNFIFLINTANGKALKGDFDEEILALGAKIVYCPSVRSVGITKYQKQLTQLIKEYAPDVVHCHLNAKCGIISKCAHKAGVKKIISHSHAKLKFKGNPIKSSLLYLELFWQRTMINKYSTDFWACSKEALSSLYYKKTLKSNRCKVINNLIDANRFIYPNSEVVERNKEKYNPNGKFVIGLVGRIAPVKNYIFALEIAKELEDRNKDFLIVLVGLKQDKEYSNKFFETVNLLNLKDNFVYVEPTNDVENVYAIMDVVLGTSIREGFSLTAVEAQLSGAYTILSNGYPRPVNLGAGNCERIDKFDKKLWADKIQDVMENKVLVSEEERRQGLIKRGFDLDVEVEKIAKEYES